jgi:hypothetical protein
MKSDKLVDIFREAIEEQGLDAEVTHYTDQKMQADVFRVSKEINGRERHFEAVMTFREQEQVNNIAQHIAMNADNIVRNFNELLTEHVSWNDKAVVFDTKEGHSIECKRCGAEASMDDLNQSSLSMSETAVPQPVTYTEFDNLPPATIRMTLHALLRDECDSVCPNSTESFKW